MIETTLSRRSLLRGSALVVGFSLAGLRPGPGHAGSATAPSKSVATDEVDAYLALSRDGRATIYSGKVDLGTGLRTALTQIAAEELDLPLDHVTVVQGDTALTPDQGPTYGSLSVQNGGMQIRLAAATARRQILALAADRLGQKPETLVAEAGSVRPQDGGAPIPYADLLRDGRFSLKLDKDVATKDPGRFALVGQPVQRLDIPDKVSGRFTYMQDFRLPGML
ncbi:MAG TPA: molybdopterin cofactor-binding domain-containing protein, partial [Methylobacterium sp.]|nr:molybdopterin cofactor-binding domain-containing protein [Methylobacterium sp.]